MIGLIAQTVGSLCLLAISLGYAFAGPTSPWVFMIGAGVLIPSPILLNTVNNDTQC